MSAPLDVPDAVGQDQANVSTLRVVTVHLVAVRESTASVLYGIFDVLTSVGNAWPQLTGGPTSPVKFDVKIVGETINPFKCNGGVPVVPDFDLATAGHADVVIVSDVVISPLDDPRGRWTDMVAWIKVQYAGGAALCSVCAASVLLADTGLLDGRPATSHWAYKRTFADFYPEVNLSLEQILVAVGQEKRIVTCAGVASWEDLALFLIARYCGQEQAIHATKIFLLGDRSHGQLPYASMTRATEHSDVPIGQVQQWIAENFAVSNPVSRMVAVSGLAERTFKRRFRNATGTSPISYVQEVRIEEAKRLLESSLCSTDEVGVAVGYEDPASFRRLFKRQTGLTPGQYRRRFRSVGRLEILSFAAA